MKFLKEMENELEKIKRNEKKKNNNIMEISLILQGNKYFEFIERDEVILDSYWGSFKTGRKECLLIKKVSFLKSLIPHYEEIVCRFNINKKEIRIENKLVAELLNPLDEFLESMSKNNWKIVIG